VNCGYGCGGPVREWLLGVRDVRIRACLGSGLRRKDERVGLHQWVGMPMVRGGAIRELQLRVWGWFVSGYWAFAMFVLGRAWVPAYALRVPQENPERRWGGPSPFVRIR